MAQKSCIQDGRYVPGDQRKAKLKAAAQLYARRPSVEHKVRGLRTAAKWETDGLLDFNDRMEEGFAARYSKELLVFDMAKDRRLNKFMRNLKAEVSRMGSGERQKILHVSRAVDRTFGGSSNEVPRDLERKIRELDLAKGDNLYIGHLMQKSDEAGAGLCRHRTLLFKYTMDRLNAEGHVGQCAAVVGVMVSKGTTDVARFRKNMGWADHAWNIVRCEGKTYLLDIMNTPGTLVAGSNGGAAMQVYGQDYMYYRYNGASGLSLAQKGVESDDSESSESEDDPNCDIYAACAGGRKSKDTDIRVFCRTTGRDEPVSEMMISQGGSGVEVEFSLQVGGKTWRARKRLERQDP